MAKIKKATSNAPHICLKVRANTFFSVSMLGRRNKTISIHEARMEVPPLSGLKLKVDESGLNTPALSATDEMAVMLHLCANLPGRCDHGPVHNTTTITKMI